MDHKTNFQLIPNVKSTHEMKKNLKKFDINQIILNSSETGEITLETPTRHSRTDKRAIINPREQTSWIPLKTNSVSVLNDNEVLSQKLNLVDLKKKTNSRNFDNECIIANLHMTDKEQSNVNN